MEHGAGCCLWDVNGNRYLDALAGIAHRAQDQSCQVRPQTVPGTFNRGRKGWHRASAYD